MDMFNLINELALYVAHNQSNDMLLIWNGWIQTGVKLTDREIPFLLALCREFIKMDKELLIAVLDATYTSLA